MRPTQLTVKCTIHVLSMSSEENVLFDNANLTKVQQMVNSKMGYEKQKYLPPTYSVSKLLFMINIINNNRVINESNGKRLSER